MVALSAVVWLVVRPTAGPLGGEGESGFGVPADVGDRLTVGVAAPEYTGSGAVVVDSLVPDAVPPGLHVLGVLAIPPGHGMPGIVRSYPPMVFPLRALEGYRFASGGVAFAVGLEPTMKGVFVIPGFTLRYHIGWHQYAAHYRQAVHVCVPMVDYLHDCGSGLPPG